MSWHCAGWSALDLHRPRNHLVRVHLAPLPANPHLHSAPHPLVVAVAHVIRSSRPLAHRPRTPAHRRAVALQAPVHRRLFPVAPLPSQVVALHSPRVHLHSALPAVHPVSHLRVHPLALALRLSVALASQAHPVSALAQVVRPVIQLFRQAHRLALSLRVRVHFLRAVAVHHAQVLSLQAVLPVIQDSLHLAPLAAHPVALHLPLQARVSRSYKASISIRITQRGAGLFRWSVLALRHTLE